MVGNCEAHSQTTAALYGTMMGEPHDTLDEHGCLHEKANPLARRFLVDLSMLEGTSVAAEFWELWSESRLSIAALYREGHIKETFLRVDVRAFEKLFFGNAALIRPT